MVFSSVPSTPLHSHRTRMNLLVHGNMVGIIAVSNEIPQTNFSIKFKTINYLVIIKEHTSKIQTCCQFLGSEGKNSLQIKSIFHSQNKFTQRFLQTGKKNITGKQLHSTNNKDYVCLHRSFVLLFFQERLCRQPGRRANLSYSLNR